MIPTSAAKHFDGEGYIEYVEDAKSNRKWIVAKSLEIKSKKENFWIIYNDFDVNKLNWQAESFDSIIQSYITGPLNYSSFEKEVKRLDIGLSFK